MSKDRIQEVDGLARRYGKLPSELKNLSMSDYQFNQFVAYTSAEIEIKQTEKGSRAGEGTGKRAKMTYNQVSG